MKRITVKSILPALFAVLLLVTPLAATAQAGQQKTAIYHVA